jgi:hypothetical protein
MKDSTIISPALDISFRFQDIYKGMVIELNRAMMIMSTSQYSLKELFDLIMKLVLVASLTGMRVSVYV